MSQTELGAEELLQLASKLKKAVRVKDRRYLFRSYPRCFVGQEAVAWLVATGSAPSPAAAVQLGNRLMEMGVFHHVMYEHVFEDDYLFYRFTDDDIIILDPLGGIGNSDGSKRPSAAEKTDSGGNPLQQSREGAFRSSDATSSDLPASASPGDMPAQIQGRKAVQGPVRTPQPAGSGNTGAAAATLVPVADGAAAAATSTAAARGSAEGPMTVKTAVRTALLESRHERQDRMRWQVIAGHLQHLQGRVAHMHTASEAQRAIADILVSEVNGLRGQVSELRGRLDDTTAVLQAGVVVAAQTEQQIAALRMLCLGLCACALQQALMSWLRPAGGGGAVTAAAGGGGVFLYVSGPCWGVAVAVTVTLMGLVLLMSRRLAGPPGVTSAALRKRVWFGWHGADSEVPGGGGGDGAADGTTAQEGSAAAADVGAQEGKCSTAAAAAASDAVPRRGSVTSDCMLVRGGGSGGDGDSAVQGPPSALTAPLRRSNTDDLYGTARGAVGPSTPSLVRRSREVVRLITAPMRLHFGLGAKQPSTCRTPVQQQQAGLQPVSTQGASAAGMEDTAYDTPQALRRCSVAAAAAAGVGAVGEEEDPIGSRYVSAVCLDGTAATVAAASGGGGLSPPPRVAAATSTVVPRMSDFEGWPDAPVLLAFDTGLVPEHATNAAAAAATPLGQSPRRDSGEDEASLVPASGELLVRVSAGSSAAATPAPPSSCSGRAGGAAGTYDSQGNDANQPPASSTAAAAMPVSTAGLLHRAAPPPPRPDLVRLRVNGVQPIRIETELFSGELVVFIKGLASSPGSLFCGKKRVSWVVMQGRFKKPLALNSVVTGQEFARPFKRLPAAWFVERVLLAMAKQISPSMRVGPLSSPALLMPLIASAQLVNVSKPGETPPLMECKEDVRLFCPRLAVKRGGAGGGSEAAAASSDVRRRYFSAPKNRAGLMYDTDHVWTFHFWQQFVDLVSYRLDFGYTYDLAQHLDGQPLQIMTKDADSGKYLFSVLVWNERLVASGTATTASAAAAAAGSTDVDVARSAPKEGCTEDDPSLAGNSEDASSYDGRSS